MKPLLALVSGFIFGIGLIFAGMTNPTKVVNFLDITGQWDPSLLFVMGTAVAVTLPGFYLVTRRSAPLFHPKFYLPTRRDLDARLIGGSALFGIGWGLAGFCPGPALTGLSSGMTDIAIFVLFLCLGLSSVSLWQLWRARRLATA